MSPLRDFCYSRQGKTYLLSITPKCNIYTSALLKYEVTNCLLSLYLKTQMISTDYSIILKRSYSTSTLYCFLQTRRVRIPSASCSMQNNMCNKNKTAVTFKKPESIYISSFNRSKSKSADRMFAGKSEIPEKINIHRFSRFLHTGKILTKRKRERTAAVKIRMLSK